MDATSLAVPVQPGTGVIVGVDLAKTVFQLCVADSRWRPVESQRLTRAQFERWFANRAVSHVVMEACGSAHHWARWLSGLGIKVTGIVFSNAPRKPEAELGWQSMPGRGQPGWPGSGG